MALSQAPPSALDTEDVGFLGAPRFCVSGVTLLQGRHREVPAAPHAHRTQILFPAWGIPDPVPISPYSHAHECPGQLTWCQYVQVVSSQPSGPQAQTASKVCEWAPGLGGGGKAAGSPTGNPRATPGPLPTADPAPPSLSHPQHNHTTTHHPATPHSHPAPPATQPQPAPPTTYIAAEKILHICFPAVQESLQPNYTPGRPNQKQIPSSAGIHCTPHPPQARSAAWPQAKLLPVTHPGAHGCHPRDCQRAGSESRGCRVCRPPCSEHMGTRGPREKKGPPAPTPTYLGPFSCPLKHRPSSSKASLSPEWDSAGCGLFQSPR